MDKTVDTRNIALQKTLTVIILSVTLSGLCSAQSALAQTHKTIEKNALVIQADFAGLVMTGVAYSVSRELDVFNVRPLIPLYDIAAASASLEYNAQTWPAGTVFVSVVDPGVGTSRKSVVLKTNNGLFFVSPDNGSLSGPADAYGIDAVREIDEEVNRIPGSDWSHTFHGRDVYSYTGARLAAGVIDFAAVGPLLEAKVIQLAVTQGKLVDGVLQGHVAGGTGRLGNVFFNMDRELFARLEPSYGQNFSISIEHDGQVVWAGVLPYVKSFGAVPVGESLMFMNSSGALSLAVNQGSFAETFSIGSGTDWIVTVTSK
jgi:S-adenosylmethionine hydrolase